MTVTGIALAVVLVITLRVVVRSRCLVAVVMPSDLGCMSLAVRLLRFPTFCLAQAKRLPQHHEECQENREGGRTGAHA